MKRILMPSHALALLRVAFGLYFLASAYEKTTHGWLTDGQPLARTLRQALPHAQPGYRQFLQQVVLPHIGLFALLTNLGEWAAGLCLLLGLFTPVGALVAIWLNSNYMLMKGLPASAGSLDRLFIAVSLILILSNAGLVWGLDGLLWKRPSRAPRPAVPRPIWQPHQIRR
jgi:NADH:quinone reductase (non-electrogenic)